MIITGCAIPQQQQQQHNECLQVHIKSCTEYCDKSTLSQCSTSKSHGIETCLQWHVEACVPYYCSCAEVITSGSACGCVIEEEKN